MCHHWNILQKDAYVNPMVARVPPFSRSRGEAVKKQPAKDQDKFVIRLPLGMRERIKAKAERAGMSMNEAIVWVLEKEFPAKVSFDERVEELANLVSMLKDSKNPDEGVENLIAEIEGTLDQIYRRKLEMPSGFSGMVADRLLHWQEQELDNWRDKNESPFDDEHYPKDGSPFPDLPD